MARGDAGVDARPDRAAGRWIRPGLRLARLHRPGAAARGAAGACRRGENPVRAFIPFARVADMLLHPGEPFDFDGRRLTYPEIRARVLVRRQPVPSPPASRAAAPGARPAGDDRRPRCVLDADGAPRRHRAAGVDDARAERHRRLPERRMPDRDASGGRAVGRGPERLRDLRRPRREPRRRPALHRGPRRDGVAAAPLRRLARPGHGRRRARCRRSTTSGRPASSRCRAWTTTWCCSKQFRADPAGAPLGTPSGRIEIFSATIDGFGYADCPGHPTWLEPTEWLGAPLAERYPLHLVANNPTARLHSQLDVGAVSQATKVQGREPIRIHPADAAARGVRRRRRGARVERPRELSRRRRRDRHRAPARRPALHRRLVRPARPADPDAMCVHGNPNVLTFDRGTSKLAQACSGQHALVEVERWTGPLPPIRAYDPPPMERRPDP